MQYPGGKVRLSKFIAPILMRYREGRDYLEPFVGACGMMQAIRGGTRIGSDVNESLILLWQGLQNGSFCPPTFVNREMYKQLKYAKEESALRGYVGACCTHMGVWFGGFHPIDFNSKRPNTQKHTWTQTLARIHDVQFHACDYSAWGELNDHVIYCDPPYAGTNEAYSTKKFDHRTFWDWCADMSKRNRVFVSESSAPEDWKPVWSITRSWQGNFVKGHKPPVREESLYVHESADWFNFEN